MAHDVFISHSVKDKITADAVCAQLEAERIRCWIAPRDIVPGSDWGEAIIEAIEGCRIMVLIFSSHANRSTQIKREIERAVHKEKIIIPFRIEKVAPAKPLEYFISTSHWLDAFTSPLEAHIAYLHRTIQRLLADTGASVSRQRMTSSGSETHAPQHAAQLEKTNTLSLRFLMVPAVAVLLLTALLLFFYLRQPERVPGISEPPPGTAYENRSLLTASSDSDALHNTNGIRPPTWSGILDEARRLRYLGRKEEALAAYSRYADRFEEVYPSTRNYITAVQAFTIQNEIIGYQGGVYIYDILPGGTARKAGLDVGDIIVAYADHRTVSTRSFVTAHSGVVPGKTARINFLRMDAAGHFVVKEVTIAHDVLGIKIMDF